MSGLKLNGALILCVLMLPFSRPNSQVLDCREVRSSFQFLYPGMKWTPETPVSGKPSYSDLRLSIFLCELKSMSKKVSKHCPKVFLPFNKTCTNIFKPDIMCDTVCVWFLFVYCLSDIEWIYVAY